MLILIRLLLMVSTWAASAVVTRSSFQKQCLDFNPANAGISNADVTEHAYITSGTNLSLSDNDESCDTSSEVMPVNICRIAIHIATSAKSAVVVEVWLPEEWNGRLVTTGNGGISGCIDYSDIVYTTNQGFASVGTNNGHNGTSGIQFLNNDEVVIDFAWRAVHKGVEAGRSLLKPFYGEAASRSYFLGCSLGGRQGVQAADLFPEDFDGIVAGAPALDFNNLYSWRASFYLITGSSDSTNFIDPTVWQTTIHNEVLRQCDSIDGVADGIIEDSSLCHFDPSTLLCKAEVANSSDCLTTYQVDIVREIFEPYFWENGTLLFPGMNPGSEVKCAEGLYDGEPFAYSEHWFRYVVYNNQSWDPATYSLADAEFSEDLNPGHIRTWPSSLFAFEARGGKMVTFQGGQDNQITSFNTPRFYDHLAKGMNYSYDQMDQFLRFFRISGMFHCNSGPGAWVFGQSGGSAAQGPFDREHNVLAALVEWVERGVAPDTITGTKFLNDSAEMGVSFKRRHCKWPLRNVYVGGNSSDPASWECRKVDQAETS